MRNTKCPCQSLTEKNTPEDFASLRESCPVLREILFPRDIWHCYQNMANLPLFSVAYGSFINGNLDKITMPIHTYLLDGDERKNNLTKQYKKDLQESWILEKDDFRACQKLRIFKGKLIEIIVAAWLESIGWTICNLEALGGRFDIEAKSPERISYGVEVKYIGIQDYRYNEFLKSQKSSNCGCGFNNLYNSYNYLLFRIYETAIQLSNCNNSRLSLIVIDGIDWSFFEMPIENGWINRSPIRFSRHANKKWKSFLEKQQPKKRDIVIENHIDEAIRSLTKVWILEVTNHELLLKKELKFDQINRL